MEEQNSQPFAKASREHAVSDVITFKVDVAKSLIILEAVIGSYYSKRHSYRVTVGCNNMKANYLFIEYSRF